MLLDLKLYQLLISGLPDVFLCPAVLLCEDPPQAGSWQKRSPASLYLYSFAQLLDPQVTEFTESPDNVRIISVPVMVTSPCSGSHTDWY